MKSLKFYIFIVIITVLLATIEVYAMGSSRGYSPPPPTKEQMEHNRTMQEKKLEHEKEMLKIQQGHKQALQRQQAESEKERLTIIVVCCIIAILIVMFAILLILRKIREGQEKILRDKNIHALKLKALDIITSPDISNEHKEKLLLFLVTPPVEEPIQQIDYIESH